MWQQRRLLLSGLPVLGNPKARGPGRWVVLGDPAYYARFGFEPDPALPLAGVLAEYFQRLYFRGERPVREVSYNPGFSSS